MIVVDEASWCAMEAAHETNEEGIMVMPIANPDALEAGGVDVTNMTTIMSRFELVTSCAII